MRAEIKLTDYVRLPDTVERQTLLDISALDDDVVIIQAPQDARDLRTRLTLLEIYGGVFPRETLEIPTLAQGAVDSRRRNFEGV